MREEVRLTIIAVILIFGFNLAILSTFVKFNSSPLLSPPIDTIIPIPTSCSPTEINTLWDAIFKVSSSGISIQTNQTIPGKCRFFLANKTVEGYTYILIGEDTESYSLSVIPGGTIVRSSESNTTRILAQKVVFTLSGQTKFNSFFALQKDTSGEYSNFLQNRTPSDYEPNQSLIANAMDAYNRYNYVFEIANISEFTALEQEVYGYENSTKIEQGNNYTQNLIEGVVSSVNELQNFAAQREKYTLYGIFSCTQNWTVYNTTCSSNETITFFYNDSNKCNNDTGKPSNVTINCDHDSNGLIGQPANISTNINLNFTADNIPINISLVYNTTKTLRFKEENITRVIFSYDFSIPLDFYKIRITKQSSSDKRGSLIVEGLPVTKTVFIDKLNATSEAVCIKDAENITSISSISDKCNSSDEDFLNCPDDSGNYECEVINNTLKISGLHHSAVKEYVENTIFISTCNPSWNCTAWTECNSSGMQAKTCVDINNCNTTLNKPALVQPCTLPINCIPSWNCTAWTECNSSGMQAKTCVDINNCNLLTNKPSEQQACDKSSGSSLLMLFIIFICVIAFIALILFVYILLKKRSSNAQFETKPLNWHPGQTPPPYAPK